VDLTHIWKAAPGLAKKGNVLAIVSLPLAAILVVLNYGRVIWADLGYGIVVGVLGPIALFRAMARL
jgi:Na+/H+ antiporter NhaB